MIRQQIKNEDTYYRIMQLIEENPHFTQRQLAFNLGISLGAINYCVKALIEKSLIKMSLFTKSKNKYKYIYLLTPKGIIKKSEITSRFIERKMKEYEVLKTELLNIQLQNAKSKDLIN